MAGATPHQNGAKASVLRSVLLSPAGDLAVLASAASAGADALLIDPSENLIGVAEFLRQRDRSSRPVFVQVSADETRVDAELNALMPGAPHGVAVMGFSDGGALSLLGARIAAREAINGLPDGSTRILPIMATGAALTRLGTIRDAGPRLLALGWDAEALAADIAAASAWESGGLIEPLAVARSLCLAAAAAAGVPAIDTAMAASAENADLIDAAESARRHGFRGKFARRADQVRILNEIFAGQPGRQAPRP